MTNDNDLLLLASSQNNGTYKVYIDSAGKKTLTPQTHNYEARYEYPHICDEPRKEGLLYGKNPKEIIFPNCSKASGDSYGAFLSAFRGCTSLTSVSFPSLTTASGDSYGAFLSAFRNCTSLTSVSFPSLTTVASRYNNGDFEYAFWGCTSLTSVSFPSLTSVIGSTNTNLSTFHCAFWGCTSLTSVSFPSLTSVIGSSSSAFPNAFYRCSPSLKVHFKKSMKGTAGLDYETMSLTSADQVVFDLP